MDRKIKTEIAVGIILLIAVVIGGAVWFSSKEKTAPGNQVAINSFEECVEAGNPVMESYPRQCRTAEGQLFVEEIKENNDGTMCIQVIAYAKDPQTGECKEFPTPCAVPEGWEICENLSGDSE